MSVRNLNISESEINKTITGYANIKKIECLNPKNRQTRYYLEKDGDDFYIDVYFNKNKTITIYNSKKCDVANELIEIIKKNDKYKEKKQYYFSCILNKKIFSSLIDYLGKIQGVSKEKDEYKGNNGRIVCFINERGDKITLTHYETNDRMMFQGYLMDLYIEVKSFISPFIENKIVLDFKDKHIEKNIMTAVSEYIDAYLKQSYISLPPIIQGFVDDSFLLMMTTKVKLSDYSPWSMPALKALEYRIKTMWGFVGIQIDDTKGFRYEYRPGKWDYLYFQNKGKTVINRHVLKKIKKSNFSCVNHLISCYKYFKENRHGLFHTKQIAEGSRILETPEEAKEIIFKSYRLIEDSFVELGK